jgi:hypothetical protein
MGQKASARPVWSKAPPTASNPESAAASGGGGLAAHTTNVTKLVVPRSAAVVLSATSIPAAKAQGRAVGIVSRCAPRTRRGRDRGYRNTIRSAPRWRR